jgi:hypothetical protein
MGNPMLLAGALELCLLPIIGIALLVASKVSCTRMGGFAEVMFLVTLLLAGLATLRTMLAGDTTWWMHAMTVAVLVVGAAGMHSNSRSTMHSVPRL